ncbi:MAG: hypothetical protein ACT6Q8_16115 [Niveispirillum sp.]|uniref:hypothetical protein n=1 Tax=Niveispirillum sp. TaxID=1917217 RepID=UPI004036E586
MSAEYKYVYHYSASAQKYGFLLPLFAIPGKNSTYIQCIDDNHEIIAMEEYNVEMLSECFYLGESISVKISDEAFYVFRTDRSDEFYGSREFIIPNIRQYIESYDNYFNPLLALDIAVFCDDRDSYIKHLSNAVNFMSQFSDFSFDFWKENSILFPEVKKVVSSTIGKKGINLSSVKIQNELVEISLTGHITKEVGQTLINSINSNIKSSIILLIGSSYVISLKTEIGIISQSTTRLTADDNLREVHESREDLDKLFISTKNIEVKQLLAGNPGVSLSLIKNEALSYSSSVRLSAIRNSSIGPDILMKLAEDKNYTVRAVVAEHPNIDGTTLEKLMKDNRDEVRNAAFRNINADFVNSKLTADEKSFSQFLAHNKNIPDSMIIEASNSQFNEVRQAVASNTITPASVLSKLSTDKNELVRYSALSNPSIDPSILYQVYQVDDAKTRAAVARNELCPTDIVFAYCEDESEIVRGIIVNRHQNIAGVLDILCNDRSEFVRTAVGRSIYSKEKILRKLSKDKDDSVLSAVAGNSRTAPEVLSFLAKSSYSNVREAVAGNKNTPPATLERLYYDGDILTRRAVLRNPSIPIRIISKK